MTVKQILDVVAPYTKDELRCGFKKKKKAVLRCELMDMIEEMTGNDQEIIETLQTFLNDRYRAAANVA